MKSFLLSGLVTCLFIMGCNNHEAEKQAAVKQALQDYQMKEQQKNKLQASIDTLSGLLEKYKYTSADFDGKIAAARDQVASVSEFHLLRSHAQREADIENANRELSKLEQQADEFKKSYVLAEQKLEALKSQLAAFR